MARVTSSWQARGEDLWNLALDCGHVVQVRSKRRPTRKIEPCETCLAQKRAEKDKQ